MVVLRERAEVAGRWMLFAALAGFLALVIAAPLMEESLLDVASEYRRFGYPVLAAVALVGLWPFANRQRMLVIPWPLVATLAWCWISLTWSVAPDLALVRLVLTTLVVWIAFATIRHLGYARALATIRVILAAALLLNYAALILYPAVAIEHQARDWSAFQWLGLMAHKNAAGALCAFTVLLFLLDVDRRWRLPFLGVALAAALFLFFTVSRTAILCGVVGMLMGGAVLATHRRIGSGLAGGRGSGWRIAGYALALLVFAPLLFLTWDSDAFLAMMTDPDALSHRAVIWRQLVQTYVEQPWTGVGFGSYWTGADSSSVPTGRAAWLGQLDQGHNGILDILVQLGLPGMVLVFVAMIVWPIRMVARQIAPMPETGALLLALLTLCAGSNFTESGLLARDSLWSVLFVLTLALVAAAGQRIDPRQAMWAPADERREAASRRSGQARRGSGQGSSGDGTRAGTGTERRRSSGSRAG